MTTIKDITRKFIPANVAAFVFWFFSIPFVYLGSLWITTTLPDRLYYNLSTNFRFWEISALFPIFLILWLIISNWVCRKNNTKRKINAFRILKILFFYILLFFTTSLFAFSLFFGYGAHFNVGHPHCTNIGQNILKKIERCEGKNYSFLQARSDLVAVSGPKAINFENSSYFSEYNLKEVPCSSLLGQFGNICYAGELLRSTGDTNYMNIYIHGESALVLEGTNVPIFTNNSYSSIKSNFLDIHRFDQEMGKN